MIALVLLRICDNGYMSDPQPQYPQPQYPQPQPPEPKYPEPQYPQPEFPEPESPQPYSFEQPALQILHLHKSFGTKHAVNDLSMNVPAGCMFGFVGPNGAGKTTTLSMVTGLLRPDFGSVNVLGHDVWSDPSGAKALMGVLPDGLRMFDRLSGKEMLVLSGEMHGIDTLTSTGRADSILAALDLSADANTMVADYSAGMTKKIGLACALIHNPKLLILDEPFEAVDPVSGQAIRTILRDFVSAGGTVVMSSHVMELVETLCDAVGVISEGSLLAAGPLDAVRQGMSLQERFISLVGGRTVDEGSLSWLGQNR
jgi:ABC-2 type transport system ATP-binding protein